MSRKSALVSASEVRASIARLTREATTATLSVRRRRTLEAEIREATNELGQLLRVLDPVSQPAVIFDPSDPKIVGRFVALALVAQPRATLTAIPKTYGSGIYAFYYSGPFAAYGPLSGSETPIYVGTASPAVANARTAFEQGTKLSDRIAYHAGNIAKAKGTLRLDDFEFRSLVVQSGWEKQAESYLIHLFRPVWNKETQIMSGFGKHGDSAQTRRHGRSPWDTLHPARTWAGKSESDQKSKRQITTELASHFRQHPPYRNIDAVLAEFFDELRQAV